MFPRRCKSFTGRLRSSGNGWRAHPGSQGGRGRPRLYARAQRSQRCGARDRRIGAQISSTCIGARRRGHRIRCIGKAASVSSDHAPLRTQARCGAAARRVAHRRVLFRLSASGIPQHRGSTGARALQRAGRGRARIPVDAPDRHFLRNVGGGLLLLLIMLMMLLLILLLLLLLLLLMLLMLILMLLLFILLLILILILMFILMLILMFMLLIMLLVLKKLLTF